VRLDEIHSRFDIVVDAKEIPQLVMIYANLKGRNIVEDLWPDVEWSTDERFAKTFPADWLFTHIRVTRLPPDFEATVPLAFAGPDVLGFAVACALYRRAWPLRVAYWTGQGDDLHIGMFNGPAKDEEGDFALFAEYVPPGPYSLEPDHHA
jgi:hypothetical protein